MVDLFCGGGGSSTGFHQAGFQTTAAIDFEPHCVNTFNQNYPDTAILKDISKLRSEKIIEKSGTEISLVTASPPCEAYTTANENRVKNPFERMYDDEVGRLMIHAIRLISDLDPDYFMMENVMGIYDGDGRELLQEEFHRMGMGDVYFNVVQASDWGVPSQRLRAIITNFKISNPRLPRLSVNDAIGDLPSPNYPDEYDYHITPNPTDRQKKKIPNLPQGEGLVHFSGATGQMKNFTRLHGDRAAPVVMGKSKFVHPFEDRLLTPQEHGRLMTFPDNYQYIGTLEQIYDIIGEAVPPKLTFEIGKQLLQYI